MFKALPDGSERELCITIHFQKGSQDNSCFCLLKNMVFTQIFFVLAN